MKSPIIPLTALLPILCATVSLAGTIPVTDSNVRNGVSPYNWVIKDNSLSSSVGGASLAINFVRTKNVALEVDMTSFPSKIPTRFPIIAWSVNGGAQQTHQLAPNETSVVLATDTTDPQIDFFIKGMSPWEDRWTGEIPVNSVKITGFRVDDGAATKTVTLPDKIWLNIGDSIMAGDGAAYASDQGRPKNDLWPESDDSRASYGYLLAKHFGYREARIAFGGYNWGGGLAKVPDLSTVIEQRISGPAPAVVLINLGTNGRPKDEQVVTALEKLRSRTSKETKVIVMIPLSGAARTEITRAFETYKRNSKDERLYLVDLGTVSIATTDKVHPTAGGHLQAFKAALPAFEGIVTKGHQH